MKRALILLSLLLLASVALFPKEILLKGIAWQTKRYCRKAFDARFTFDSLSWEGKGIVMRGGKLVGASAINFSFKEAYLVPFLDIKNWSLDGNLIFRDVKVIHKKQICRPLPEPQPPSLKLLNFHLQTTVEQGELFLYDLTSKQGFAYHAYFDLKHQIDGKQTSGTIAFNMEPSSEILAVSFSHDKKSLVLAAQFQSKPCPLFSRLACYFFDSYLPPAFFQWEIMKGSISGELDLTVTQGIPLNMKAKIDLKEMEGGNLPLNLIAHIDQLSGDLDIDFLNASSIRGEIDLKGGSVALNETKTFFDEMWDLKNVHANICIEEGRVKSSQLKGRFMGMEGNMALDCGAKDTLMEMAFAGSSRMVQSLIPEKMQKSFEKAFADDSFSISASVKRKEGGLELVGKLGICARNSSPYELSFGCKLTSQPQQFKIDALVPENFSLSRSIDSFMGNIKTQFCLSHKRFGWFQGNQFPLEKFLSPFLLQSEQMQLSGLVDFKATFDEHFLILFYEGRDFLLESPKFSLHIDSIKEPFFRECSAAHYFDLKTWEHVGFLPVNRGSYWQKNYDFHLDKASALINFENNEIHIKNIKTESEGIEFEGEVEIIRTPTDMDFKIKADHMKGSAVQAQKFLSHFKPLHYLPFEGQVEGKQNCLSLHCKCAPLFTLIEGSVESDVLLHTSNPLFSIQDYRAHVSYDCKKGEIDIKNGTGILSLTQSAMFEANNCYTLTTPLITLTSLDDLLFNFSCAVTKDKAAYLNLHAQCCKTGDEKHYSLFAEGLFLEEPISIKAIQSGNLLHTVEFGGGGRWSAELETEFHNRNVVIKNFSLKRGGEQLSFAGSWDLDRKLMQGKVYDIAAKIALPSNECQLVCDLARCELILDLAQGSYPLFGRQFDLRNCHLVADAQKINMWSQIQHEGRPFWLHAISDSLLLQTGRLNVSEKELTRENQKCLEGVVATWEKSEEGLFTIKKAQGFLSGVEIDLQSQATSGFLALKGHVTLFPEKMQKLLSGKCLEFFQTFPILGGFTLEGVITADLPDISDVRFKGELCAHEYEIKGVSLNALHAQTELSLNEIKLENISIRDWAGRLSVNRAKVHKDQQKKWSFFIDHLSIHDLRLGRLKSPWTKWKARERPFFSSLCIPAFELEDIGGEISSSRSILGKGKFEFTNLPRKTIFSNLLFLPTEINARIGLDLTTLIPVRGLIDYEIMDGKIRFTHFNEMYSDGKRSRFYLAEGSDAFIDFSGNVDMKVKMKQYTLLMKLAEFFTLSINGKLPNLCYTFKNPANLTND